MIGKKLFLVVVCLALSFTAKSVTQYFFYAFDMDKMESTKAGAFFNSPIQVELADTVARGKTNKIQSLIAAGADVNYSGVNGMRPLFWAMAKENFTGFKFLLDNGADPNATQATKQPPPENALTLAASMDEARYLEELLKHGANPNALAGYPSEEAAIYIAVLSRKPDNISVLLKYGADINYTNLPSRETPIKYAVLCGSFKMALFLYEHGADPTIKSRPVTITSEECFKRWGFRPRYINHQGSSAIDIMKEFKNKGVHTSEDKKAYYELVDEFIKRGWLDAPP